MATISTLAVNLIARTSVFERGMNRGRKSLKGFKQDTVSATTSLVRFAKRLLLTGGAVWALKSLTGAASRAEETMNLFNTVFAENAKETAKWADSFAKNIGRSRTEVKEWAASLQDTFVPLGFARDRAAELSMSLVELAVDVASFKNVADAEVIESFTSAIVGNGRAVRKFGIVLTNATLEAESFASGLDKTFAKLTELEKVQLRYNVIMKSTKDAQGDAAKTANAYANRVKKLQGIIADLKESIGAKLLPVMSKMLQSVIKNRDSIVSVTKKILLFSAKTAILIGVIASSIKVIFLVTKAIKLLSSAYVLLATNQAIFLALTGPAGWATLLLGVSVAVSALAVIDKAVDNLGSKMKALGSEPVDLEIKSNIPKTIPEFEKSISLLQSALKRQKTLTLADPFEVRPFVVADIIKTIKLRQKQLDILKEEERVQKRIAFERSKAGRIAEEQAKRLLRLSGESMTDIANILEAKFAKDDPDEDVRTRLGRFQQIRSEFVDVAALNPTSNQVVELKQLNEKTDKSNSLLEELNRNVMGVFQA